MKDLTGTIVLVHPDLMDDPVNRQGQAGVIASTDLERDEVYVGFGSGPLGLYSSDALLVLKPHHEIYNKLLNHVKEMNLDDFKIMLRISMLMQSGSSKLLTDALKMAMSSPQTLSQSTISLQDKLRQEQGRDVPQNIVNGR